MGKITKNNCVDSVSLVIMFLILNYWCLERKAIPLGFSLLLKTFIGHQ